MKLKKSKIKTPKTLNFFSNSNLKKRSKNIFRIFIFCDISNGFYNILNNFEELSTTFTVFQTNFLTGSTIF